MKIKLYTKQEVIELLYKCNKLVFADNDPCFYCYPTVEEGYECYAKSKNLCEKEKQYIRDCQILSDSIDNIIKELA